MKEMYSRQWFDTFAATVPPSITETEVAGIRTALSMPAYCRILDVGCGIGRLAVPLSACGYAVTGLDVNIDALRHARQLSPQVRYIALDQQHIGRMRWRFDGALLLWNSLGFVGRVADRETLSGLAQTLRAGGKLILDLYHPQWLARNERAGGRDRGAVVRRWMEDKRCLHEIRYANGQVDDIGFEVYEPEEIRDLVAAAGFEPAAAMVWWNPQSPANAEQPRYQLVATRR